MRRVLVCRQNQSGLGKIQGILRHSQGRVVLRVHSEDTPLSVFFEKARDLLPDISGADLVPDYFRHPDLSHAPAVLCREKGLLLVARGKKTAREGALCPPACCGLSPDPRLGVYGELFGAPVFTVRYGHGRVAEARVHRGAPCGATREAAKRLEGVADEEAALRTGLETRFFRRADPAGWDPLFGKSPVPFAGRVHSLALSRALSAKGFDSALAT
jgi:hypothetical protein